MLFLSWELNKTKLALPVQYPNTPALRHNKKLIKQMMYSHSSKGWPESNQSED